MKALAVVLSLAVCSCGSTLTTSGDAANDTPSHDATETAGDVADPPPDTAGDAPDATTGCTTHEECLGEDYSGYCGPCGYWSCPCDPAEDPVCSPDCMPNRCHDGTMPVCPMPPPDCEDWEVLTVTGSCWSCLNLSTCMPWGEPGCAVDAECRVEEYCDPCASGSCPGCEDCVPGCADHGCPTETTVDCGMVRPECGDDGVAVARDGCWECVLLGSCEPMG